MGGFGLPFFFVKNDYICLMKICGIYKITNPKGKVYIGQSRDIKKRWQIHKKHTDPRQRLLYNSMKKYGYEAHVFKIIQECDVEYLNPLELYFCELYKSCDREYGLNLKAGGGYFTIFSEETRLKMKNRMRNCDYLAKWNKENRDILSKRSKDMWSKNRRKMLKSLRKAAKKRMGKYSIHAINKAAIANSKPVLNLDTGIFYDSVIQASICHNIDRRRLMGGKYPFIYV